MPHHVKECSSRAIVPGSPTIYSLVVFTPWLERAKLTTFCFSGHFSTFRLFVFLVTFRLFGTFRLFDFSFFWSLFDFAGLFDFSFFWSLFDFSGLFGTFRLFDFLCFWSLFDFSTFRVSLVILGLCPRTAARDHSAVTPKKAGH